MNRAARPRRRIHALLVLALLAGAVPAPAEQPPAGLVTRIAGQGTRFEQERERYTYRQIFRFQELDRRGAPLGFYEEEREILFNEEGERTESFASKPVNRLERIRLTGKDFQDLRDIQPFVLTENTLWFYEVAYKGKETVNGEPCYAYRLKPRQVLEGQRFLDGWIWVSREHLSVVRVAGKPVPQIYGEQENLFPSFVTVYEQVDGEFWFPVRTVADDILGFSGGAQRVHYEVLYKDYQRFTAETKVDYGAGKGDSAPEATPEQ